MTETTSHVPITPRIGTEAKPLVLGYFAMPVIAEAISKCNGGVYRLSLDDLTTSSEAEEHFLGNLESLGLKWGEVVRNKDESSHQKVATFITQGLSYGYITKEIRDIASCFNSGGCGKSEFLSLPDNALYSDGRHKCVDGETCTLCLHPIKVLPVESLLWNIGDDGHFINNIFQNIYPRYAATEMKDHWTKLKGQKLLISRQRQTEFAFNLNGQTNFIDNDLINYLNLINTGNRSNLSLYFSGQGVLRQVLLMCLAGMQSDLDRKWRMPKIIAVPRINLTSSYHNEPCENVQQYLEKGISRETLKVFLMQAFGSSGKEISLDSAAIFHIDLAVKKLNKEFPNLQLTHSDNTIDTLGGIDYRQTLQSLVKKIKRPNFSIANINQSEALLLSSMRVTHP